MNRQYLLSLPERAVRSACAVTGGLLRELGGLTLPAAVRRTRLYRNLVDDTLRFLIESVGQVEGVYPEGTALADNFAIRRTAGNGIETIGLLTFHVSPVWVLVALADLTGAGRRLIREIAESLKQEGLLDQQTNFESMDQVLDGLENTSAWFAEAINTPPLDVKGLRREWEGLRQAMAAMPVPTRPSADRIRGAWEDLKATAAAQQRSVFEVSSLLALSSVSVAARRTGEIVVEALLEHYLETLAAIRREGYLTFWVTTFRPYLRAAAAQFEPERTSLTERLLRKGFPRPGG